MERMGDIRRNERDLALGLFLFLYLFGCLDMFV